MLYVIEMEQNLSFGKKLAKVRRDRKMTQAQLAEQLSVTPQAVSGWERDESKPELDKVEKLSLLLDMSLTYLLRGDSDATHGYMAEAAQRAEENRPSRQELIPGERLVGARDFPIYAAAQGGDGFMIVHSDVMEYVKRPVILEGVPDSYGVLIVGESMIPAYRPGDMALVHPRRPMERNSDVILYDHDHRTGDARSMIKRLIGFNDRQFKLEQFNPAKTFNEHRADWPICHQVVGMYKGR